MTELNEKVGEIVASDYRKASIFRKYGIDFCCGGGKDIATVCKEKDLDPGQLINELENELWEINDDPGKFMGTPLDELVEHIVNNHHVFVKQTGNDLLQYLDKVVRVHGVNDPELKFIQSHFVDLLNELTNHMQKEEMVLFPYIRQMVRSYSEDIPLETPMFGSVKYPINAMEVEHTDAGDLLTEIRMLTRDYTPPAHACKTYEVAFRLLEDFEKDLHMHVHLENNVLFPRAIEMENELFARKMT